MLPILQKLVLQRPLCGGNKMNCACVVLSSFKREREDVRGGVGEGLREGGEEGKREGLV